MLGFKIVDTHLHVWDLDHLRYPWLDDLPLLNKNYLLDDYNAACGSVEVEQMVFLQCECDPARFLAEAQWVASLAEQDDRIAGIVPFAPLEKGQHVRPDLERLVEIPRVKGIRRIIQFEPDIEFCLRPDFVRGVQMLAEFDLTFDICISHIHMANTIKMVQQCPGVTFILDHIGKPDIAHGVTEPWKTQLKTLAGLPNVHCKMSGVVSEADHENWQPDDIRPYIDHVFDCFGLDRIMFGGDWPPVLQAAEYEKWVSTLLWAVEGLSDSQMKKLFRENARAFYRLEPGD